ncbi:Protein CBG08667 [Caenorhabditis briggsae]|uniref:Protein CBG08667 n=1 Tax=Caenorhabditis briggsae TaxID=6238 RepID=A8X6V1_CAEBR|nr:Protein CBG08667 [Caenorhabditis briggsae]CAP28362.2 Protein CBG08667 [Caenorhabditis briggsae]
MGAVSSDKRLRGRQSDRRSSHPNRREYNVTLEKLRSQSESGWIVVPDEGATILERLFTNADQSIKMYGSPKELAENLKVFRDFSGNDDLFNFSIGDPYNHTVVKHRSLKNEQYIYKRDLFQYMMMTLIKNTVFLNEEVLCAIAMFTLRSSESQLAECCEFIKHDPRIMQEVQKDLVIHVMAAEDAPTPVIAVRIFDDGSEQFVMKRELFDAINITNPSKKPLVHDENHGFLSTLSTDYDGEFSKYSNLINGIEFIRVPIKRAKHGAVPLPAPNGGHCILAVDAFFEILRPLIFNRKIFQKFKKEKWYDLRAAIFRFENLLPSDIVSILVIPKNEKIKFQKRKNFVLLDLVDQYRAELNGFCDIYEKIQTKSISDAPEDGFASEYLQKELKSLGFTDLFPRTVDYADRVYQAIKQKKGAFLKTADLFDAIEKCVVLAILKEFPNLGLFIHNQNECERLLFMDCEKCSQKTKSVLSKTKWTEYTYREVIPVYDERDPENPVCSFVSILSFELISFQFMFKLICGGKTVLIPNYKFFNEEDRKSQRIKYFNLDQKDVDSVSENEKPTEDAIKNGKLLSLEGFDKFDNKKQIYVRAFPSTRADGNKRVFWDDVLECLAVGQDRCGFPMYSAYKNHREIKDADALKTLSLTEFEHFCSNYEIDKSMFTVSFSFWSSKLLTKSFQIVPDAVYEVAVHQFLTDCSNRTISIYSPNGRLRMRVEHAVYHVFQSVYCDVNWSKEICKKHPACLQTLREKIMQVMTGYIVCPEGDYVAVDHVEARIADIKTHCYFQIRKSASTPLSKLYGLKFDDKISCGSFRSDSELFGYHKLLKISPKDKIPKDKTILAYVARNRFLVANFQLFYDASNYAINTAIIDELKFKYPNVEQMREDFSLYKIELPQKTTEDFAQHVTPRPTKGDTKPKASVKKVVKIENSENPVIGTCKFCEEASKTDIKPHNNTIKADHVEKVKKETFSYDSDNEALLLENEQLKIQLNACQTQLMKSQDNEISLTANCEELMQKLGHWESLNNTPGTLQNTVCALEEEKEALTKDNNRLNESNKLCLKSVLDLETHYQREREVVGHLQSNIVLLQRDVISLRADNQNYAEDENQLYNIVVRRELQLEEEQEKVRQLNEFVKKLERTLEIEIRELRGDNQDLADTNNLLLEKIGALRVQLEKTKQTESEAPPLSDENIPEVKKDLKESEELSTGPLESNCSKSQVHQDSVDRVASHTPCSPTTSSIISVSPSMTGEPDHDSESVMALLARFQKIKENFREEEQVQQAKDMVEELKNLSSRSDIRMLANYELQQYEGKIRDYCQTIEIMYQRLKKTRDISSFAGFPSTPCFSERFMEQYCKHMDAK